VPPEAPRILVSGVFVAGSVGLEIGSRYLIELGNDHLRVLGPADRDPTAVAFDRSIDEMDAIGLNGRLILNERAKVRGGSVLAFMSIAGGSPDSVAEAVVQRARQIQGTAR
jgi:hypothetical protein